MIACNSKTNGSRSIYEILRKPTVSINKNNQSYKKNNTGNYYQTNKITSLTKTITDTRYSILENISGPFQKKKISEYFHARYVLVASNWNKLVANMIELCIELDNKYLDTSYFGYISDIQTALSNIIVAYIICDDVIDIILLYLHTLPIALEYISKLDVIIQNLNERHIDALTKKFDLTSLVKSLEKKLRENSPNSVEIIETINKTNVDINENDEIIQTLIDKKNLITEKIDNNLAHQRIISDQLALAIVGYNIQIDKRKNRVRGGFIK